MQIGFKANDSALFVILDGITDDINNAISRNNGQCVRVNMTNGSSTLFATLFATTTPGNPDGRRLAC